MQSDRHDSADCLRMPTLCEREFNLFGQMILEHCGIRISDNKRVLLQNRIGKRLRELGFDSFTEYYKYITTSAMRQSELVNLWSAITTNVTHFFREPHHFDSLKKQVLPYLMEKNRASKSVRVWSAGCSTGQEPYTLAMVLLDFFEGRPNWKVSIVGSDVDVNVVAQAKLGLYAKELKSEIPAQYFYKYFENDVNEIRIKQRVKSVVAYRRQNLRDLPIRPSKYDLIFCRNVMMYFDREFRKDLIGYFHRSLNDGGYLFLGTSESLTGMPKLFQMEKLDSSIVYRKTD